MAIAKNAREKAYGARIENAEIIQKKNKMLLLLLLRYMDGDSPSMI